MSTTVDQNFVRTLSGNIQPSPMHSGIDTTRFYRMHFIAAAVPLIAGLLLQGWRALLVMIAVTLSATIATYFWRRIGGRGSQLRYSHTCWMSLLLTFTLPSHIASATATPPAWESMWPILPAAGLALVMVMWLSGGIGGGRLHPVVITYLLLAGLFAPLLESRTVLQRSRLFVGDVLDAAPAPPATQRSSNWFEEPLILGHDGIRSNSSAAEQLQSFTQGNASVRAWASLEGLIRDQLSPLENFILAGHPSPIGSVSALALIVCGLLLQYRGLIDARIPLLICLAFLLSLLILPVPTLITESGRQWHWLIWRQPEIGWPIALTFANYQLFASPLLFVAIFLATSPQLRPMVLRGRIIYALLLGILMAVMQLYVSVSTGPYLALLCMGFLAPLIDRLFKPRPMF